MGGAGGDAPQIGALGEAALLVTFGDRIDAALNERAHALAEALRDARHTAAGLGWPVPAYASVLVPFDPLRVTAEAATEIVDRLLERTPLVAAPDEPPLEMRVRYGGADGPDLAEVAERTGLTPEAVVELHVSVEYRAYMLGFAPGFAYLGELPAELDVPRRPTPRQRVAAGSVAIAGRQTAVYPQATPGGWQLIGRTDHVLWDIQRDPPALIMPGRRVRFVPA